MTSYYDKAEQQPGHQQPDVIRSAVARSFRADDAMEHLNHLKENEPARYAALPPTSRVALGHYLAAKSAAQQNGTSA